MLLPEGTLIRETYLIDVLAGAGAFADVYRVRHKFFGRRLAMKVLRQEHMSESQLEALFYEPRLLFELEHPHIIRVFDAGLLELQHGRRGYFVTEYAPNGSLRDYLRHKPGLALTEAVTLARQICEGMAFAHRQRPPIIHRDLKPENVLMRYGGEGLCAKISDFGLAKYVDEMTRWTSVAGTSLYKPPEAFKQVDSVAGDVFAIGIILYEMLTGELPFATEPASGQDSRESLLVQARRAPLRVPSRINLAVDSALDAIVQMALAFRPQERYPSAVEFLTALRDYEQHMQDTPAWAPMSERTGEAPPVTGASQVLDAQRYLRQALDAARQAATLPAAVDSLEKALTLDASLRPKYTKVLSQWKRGVVL